MQEQIKTLISTFPSNSIDAERKVILNALVDFIQSKKDNNEPILLNFICTHNSRRSHLGQIWAQTMGHYFDIPHLFCYSGGTEQTAVYPQILETLKLQGFELLSLSEGTNPVYALKYDANRAPIILFSKEFYHPFNPQTGFAAIMTCDSADENCPFVAGAEKRIPIKYSDPKAFDESTDKAQKYIDKSVEIAQEMGYVFSSIRNS